LLQIKKEFISHLNHFMSAEAAMIKQILDGLVEITVDPQRIIFKPGDSATEHMYILVHGELAARYSSEEASGNQASGATQKTERSMAIGVGAVFGFLKSGDVTPAKIVTVKRSTLYVLRKPKLLAVYVAAHAFTLLAFASYAHLLLLLLSSSTIGTKHSRTFWPGEGPGADLSISSCQKPYAQTCTSCSLRIMRCPHRQKVWCVCKPPPSLPPPPPSLV
jgi:hypothetical protein